MTDFESIRRNLSLDPDGSLTLNGLPMILLPRHFFLYIMEQVEAVAGPEALGRIYRKAGFDGAVTFCRRYAEVHHTQPRATVAGYLDEMSHRGWGRFEIVALDERVGRLEVRLYNSALSSARLRAPRHEVWVGAMEGAMSYLAESMGRPHAFAGREIAARAGDPEGACRIHVEATEGAK